MTLIDPGRAGTALLVETISQREPRPPRAPRWRLPLRRTATVRRTRRLAAVAAAGGVFLVLGWPVRPYEIAFRSTGMISVTAHGVSDPAPANSGFRAAGVPAAIILGEPGCRESAERVDPALPMPRTVRVDMDRLEFDPAGIAPGTVLVITVFRLADSDRVFLDPGLYRAPAPACVFGHPIHD